MTPSEFNALSFRERRMLVATDVLAQIEAGTYTAAGGSGVGSHYIRRRGQSPWDPAPIPARGDAGYFVNNECSVCAIGAACVSATRLGIDTTAWDLAINLRPLWSLFDQSDSREKQMRYDLESCFEGSAHTEEARTNRLKSIFQNIIANNGDFVREHIDESGNTQHYWHREDPRRPIPVPEPAPLEPEP